MPKHKINPLLRLTLWGLPELEHFPTPQSRDTALWELGRDAGTSAPRSLALGIFLMAAGTGSGLVVAQWLLSLVRWPIVVEKCLLVGLTAGSAFLLMRHFHRQGFVTGLRKKLLGHGVPICVPCGYLLKGLPETSTMCPECGKEIEDAVRSILKGKTESISTNS